MDPAVGMPFDVMRLEPIPAGAVERIHRHRDQAIGPRLPPGAHLTARHQPQLVATRHQSPFNDLTVRGREPARQTPRRATQRCAAANRPTRARPKNQGASTVGRPAPASTRCSIATARSSPTSPASNDRSTQRCRTNRPAAHTRSDATARDTSNRPNRYPTIERHPAPAATPASSNSVTITACLVRNAALCASHAQNSASISPNDQTTTPSRQRTKHPVTQDDPTHTRSREGISEKLDRPAGRGARTVPAATARVSSDYGAVRRWTWRNVNG